MIWKSWRNIGLLALLLLPAGCTMEAESVSVGASVTSRSSVRTDMSMFYDELEPHGRWFTYGSYGWCWTPYDRPFGWRPYTYGHWSYTDMGWTWMSDEPFGWATYHYGEWFWDRFQGWVWRPGLDWSPGWATWELAGDYVGWGPMSVRSSAGDAPPSNAMHYAPLGQLGATDLRDHLVPTSQIGAALNEARPVRNMIQRDGVTFNRGPAFGLVEERSGPLTRVRVENLAPADPGKTETSIETTRRAAEDAAAEARRWSLAPNGAPSRLPVVRPSFGPRPEPAGPTRRTRPPRRESPTPADTTR
jgi:hypothetical protein